MGLWIVRPLAGGGLAAWPLGRLALLAPLGFSRSSNQDVDYLLSFFLWG